MGLYRQQRMGLQSTGFKARRIWAEIRVLSCLGSRTLGKSLTTLSPQMRYLQNEAIEYVSHRVVPRQTCTQHTGTAPCNPQENEGREETEASAVGL